MKRKENFNRFGFPKCVKYLDFDYSLPTAMGTMSGVSIASQSRAVENWSLFGLWNASNCTWATVAFTTTSVPPLVLVKPIVETLLQ